MVLFGRVPIGSGFALQVLGPPSGRACGLFASIPHASKQVVIRLTWYQKDI